MLEDKIPDGNIADIAQNSFKDVENGADSAIAPCMNADTQPAPRRLRDRCHQGIGGPHQLTVKISVSNVGRRRQEVSR
jgi:hypothetical protein